MTSVSLKGALVRRAVGGHVVVDGRRPDRSLHLRGVASPFAPLCGSTARKDFSHILSGLILMLQSGYLLWLAGIVSRDREGLVILLLALRAQSVYRTHAV